jgi:GntR family transcriptional regulator
MTPATQVLNVDWATADKEGAQLLGLKHGSRVKQIDRLRTVNGEPIGLNQIVLLEKWALQLREQDFSRSFYELLATTLEDEIKEAEQRIEAAPATTAQAELLQVQPGAPLLRIVRTTYLQRHGLIGLTRTYYRGDRYFLSLTVSRKVLGRGAAE